MEMFDLTLRFIEELARQKGVLRKCTDMLVGSPGGHRSITGILQDSLLERANKGLIEAKM